MNALFGKVKEIVDAILEGAGLTAPTHPPAPTMDQFRMQWMYTYFLYMAYLMFPDDRDDLVGPVGTEPRDTLDSGGDMIAAYNAMWP